MKSLIAKKSLDGKKAHPIPIKDLFSTFKQVDQGRHKNVGMVTESIKEEGMRYPIVCWSITKSRYKEVKNDLIPRDFNSIKTKSRNKRKWQLMWTISKLKEKNDMFLNDFSDCFDEEGNLTKDVYVVFAGGCRIAAAKNLGYDVIDSVVYDGIYPLPDMTIAANFCDEKWSRPDLKRFNNNA